MAKYDNSIGVAVIGYGYWGPNLVRNLAKPPDGSVVAVCDTDPQQRERAKRHYPGVRTFGDVESLLSDEDVDAVAIATPVSTHCGLAMSALEAGKHVWVEKPIASCSAEAKELIAEARSRGLTLMVDHTFVYTGAVRKLKQLIDAGEIGDWWYYDSVRVNLGMFQSDVNVLWDLAVHDLSILDYLLPARVKAVSATGISHVNGHPEDTAYLTLFFDEPILAHIHVNWLAPVKIRQTLIGGNSKMIVYNDLEPSEKLHIYDKGINTNTTHHAVRDMLVGYRTGDMWCPRVEDTEALEVAAAHFFETIISGEEPITNGESGLRVVGILEAAMQSLAQRGAPVEVGPNE